jgi:hypothetical protein
MIVLLARHTRQGHATGAIEHVPSILGVIDGKLGRQAFVLRPWEVGWQK